MDLSLLMLPLDFGVIVGILATTLVLARQVRKLGRDVVLAELFLTRKGTERVTVLLLAALLALVLSNVLQVLGLGIDLPFELAALAVLLLALVQAASILGRLRAAEAQVPVPGPP